MRERYSVAPQTPQSADQEIDYDSLHGGDYDLFPTLKKQVFQVNRVLRGIVKGEVDIDELDHILDNPEVNSAFTTEHPMFGNKSYLSRVRQTIEQEKQLASKVK